MKTLITVKKYFLYSLLAVVAAIFLYLVTLGSITTLLAVRLYTSDRQLLISNNGFQFGYFQELDESAAASKFAKQVEKEINRGKQ